MFNFIEAIKYLFLKFKGQEKTTKTIKGNVSPYGGPNATKILNTNKRYVPRVNLCSYKRDLEIVKIEAIKYSTWERDKFKIDLASILIRLMEEKDMTVSELSEKSGVGTATIYSLMRANNDCNTMTVSRVLKPFDLTLSIEPSGFI